MSLHMHVNSLAILKILLTLLDEEIPKNFELVYPISTKGLLFYYVTAEQPTSIVNNTEQEI